MSPKTLQITIQTTADLKGIESVKKQLADLMKASAGAGGAGGKGGSSSPAKPLADTGAAAAKAEKQILSLASAQARLQSTQGNTATAAQTLSAALAKVDQSSIAGIRTQTQLAQVHNKLSGQSQSLTALFQGQSSAIAGLGQQMSGLGGTVGGLSSSFGALAGSMGTLGAAGAAIGVGKVVFDLAEAGANADLVRTRFDSLAEAAGTTGEALIGALRKASGNEISDLNLQLAANKAQLLGVADSAEEFGTLMAIAKDRAQQMGISTTQAFNDLVTGLGRGSALILDNLGITISVTEANEAYAKSLGKSVTALTEAESKQALINAVLTQGKASLDATGGAVESNAGKIAQGQAAFDNLKVAVGQLAAIKLGPLASDIGAVTNALAGAGDIGSALSGGFDLVSRFNPQIDVVRALTSAVDQAGGALGRLAGIEVPDGFSPLRNSIQQWLDLLGLVPPTEAEVAQSHAQAAAAAVAGAGAYNVNTQAVISNSGVLFASSIPAQIGFADALAQTTIQANAAAQAAQLKANADQLGSVEAQTHAVAQNALAQQAQIAAQALLASGGSGASAAALLAGSSSQVDVLTAAYYRLAAAQAAAGQAATLAKLNKQTPRQLIGADSEESDLRRNNRAALNEERNARVKASQDAVVAERNYQQTLGNTAPALAHARNELAQLTVGSAAYINKQSEIARLQQQTDAAAKKGGGGAARVSAAEATAAKLIGIEEKTGLKLADIIQDTQGKITAIAEREAAKQAAALQKLNDSIDTAAADRRVSGEVDDLDAVGVTDEKEAARINDRERAQADARKREADAAAEARATAESGDAELAQKQFDIKTKQIDGQQQLDEKYYARQRELAGDPAAQQELTKQYDEGTRAYQERADTELAIAKAESEQKKAEVQAEKDAVIAAANEQANQVVSAAERGAAGVTKATGTARATAVANLRAIGDAVTAIPANKTITITVNQQGTVGASSAGGSGPKMAGGGTFVTSGKTQLTVGDNPGGRELVTVIPLSGKGQTRMGGSGIALAGGGVIDAGGGYTTPIAGGPPPKGGGGGGGKGGGGAPVDPKKALDEMKNTIALLMDMAKLKEQIAALAGVPAFDIPVVQALIARAQEFTTAVNAHLVPLTKEQGESLGRYLSAAKDAVSLIGDMASLKKDIAELKNVPAFDQAMVLALIDRAEQFTKAVQQHLIPLTEFERDQIGRYTEVVGDVVSMLTDVADLKKELSEPAPPIDTRYINQLVADAAVVTVIMRGRLVPTTEEQADAVGLYASVVGDTVSILNDVIDLGKNLKEDGVGAISDQMIIALADQAARITTLVQERLIPATEAQNDAASAYADVVGSSVSALKDVASLTSDLFTDYTSPTDAQLAILATDAQRVTAAFFQAGQVMGKEGAEAGKAYAEGVGATFAAVKDGLEVFDRLRFSDISVDPKNLALLHDSSVMVLDTVAAIGKQAAMIPSGDIAAMNSATGAIKAYSEAMVTLAAVPFADLPRVAGAFGAPGAGSVGGDTIIHIHNPPAGMNVPAVIQQVKTGLSQQTARRY